MTWLIKEGKFMTARSEDKVVALMHNDALWGRGHDTGTLKLWEKKEELDHYAAIWDGY